MNNSCLPECIFSEANCRCLLTHKSAFWYKQRKILSPKVIFCLHFEAVLSFRLLPACLRPAAHRAPEHAAGWESNPVAPAPCVMQGAAQPRNVGLLLSIFLPSMHSRAASSTTSSATKTAPVFPGMAPLTSPLAAAGTGHALGRRELAAPRSANQQTPGPTEGCEPTRSAHTGRAG